MVSASRATALRLRTACAIGRQGPSLLTHAPGSCRAAYSPKTVDGHSSIGHLSGLMAANFVVGNNYRRIKGEIEGKYQRGTVAAALNFCVSDIDGPGFCHIICESSFGLVQKLASAFASLTLSSSLTDWGSIAF